MYKQWYNWEFTLKHRNYLYMKDTYNALKHVLKQEASLYNEHENKVTGIIKGNSFKLLYDEYCYLIIKIPEALNHEGHWPAFYNVYQLRLWLNEGKLWYNYNVLPTHIQYS